MSKKRIGSNGPDWNKTVKYIESKKDRNRRNRDYIEQVEKRADEWDVYCKTTVGFVVIYEEKIHCCGNDESMVNFLNDKRVLEILKEYCPFTDRLEMKKPLIQKCQKRTAATKERKTKRKTGGNHNSTKTNNAKKKKKEEKKVKEKSHTTETDDICCKDFCLKPEFFETFVCDKCHKTYHNQCVDPRGQSCGCHLITPLIVERKKRLSWLEDLVEFKKKYSKSRFENMKRVISQRNGGYHESVSSTILPLFKANIIGYLEDSIKEVLPEADYTLMRQFLLPEMMVRTVSIECKCPMLAVRRLFLERIFIT
eukprot:TCONS_00059882-protein